jgi:hypothetical protein
MRILFLMLTIVLPATAFSASVKPLPKADAPHFIPLNQDHRRSGLNPLRPNSALHSDSAALANGFFRIDRKAAAPMPLQHALIIQPNSTTSDQPRVISGASPALDAPPQQPSFSSILSSGIDSSDPVLALFGSMGSAATSGAGASFRDSLLGSGPPSTAPAAEPGGIQKPTAPTITRLKSPTARSEKIIIVNQKED